MSQELQHRLMQRVQKYTLPAKVLLSRFYFPDEEMRKKPEYQDNTWMPFWYYLGLEEQPNKVLDIGSHLGLEAALCVLGSAAIPTGRSSNNALVTICEQQSRFTTKNVKLLGASVEYDVGFGWDLAIVNGDFCGQLDSIWDKMKLGGLICVTDNKEMLEGFAKIKNRVPVFCKLRYSVGLLRK